MRSRRTKPHPWSRILADVRWGVLFGWLFAALFSLWVLVVTVLRGSTRFDKYGMTTWGIILTYFAAATVAGALVGLLRPLTRTRAGGAIVGALAGVFVYGAISVAMDGWRDFDVRFALIAGIPVGGFCGYRFSGQQW